MLETQQSAWKRADLLIYKIKQQQIKGISRGNWTSQDTIFFFTFRVLMVSSTAAGVIVQIIDVLAFPPSEDCKIRVSLESRNGMKLKRQNANVIGVSKVAMQT